jgi:hypothetical protein
MANRYHLKINVIISEALSLLYMIEYEGEGEKEQEDEQ